jgi:hypothetical protein
MKFNKFIWNLYISSEQGEKALKRYSHLTADYIEKDLCVIDVEFYEEVADQYPVRKFPIEIPQLVQNEIAGVEFKDLDAANLYYEESLVKNGIPFKMADNKGKEDVVYIFGEENEYWYDCIAAISLGLYWAHPNLFIPYDFRTKFNQLEEIHTEFNIPFPPIPGKFKKEDRALYYLSINQTWQEFRNLYGLSPEEFCAFLYDFAPQFTTPLNGLDLPSPSKVWMVTGGSWDFEYLENATDASVSRWGGNPSIRRGDILMMYCVSPQCYIHSIWRACSDGFIDPFFHYHGTVWICGRMKTKPVSFSELKQHPLLSQKPAIRGNFQGPSGKASFSVEEYEAVLEIMKNKGQDISILPRIPISDYVPPVDLLNERDVEVYLIEPFLKRLGYQEKDWVRQMPVKMGRGERNYPDYAIGANAKRGEESAKMILESKFQLSARKEFIDAFYQAKSYALRLQSKIMALAAKEGVWIFQSDKGNFQIQQAFYKSWGELNHPDAFHVALSAIGKDVVCK